MYGFAEKADLPNGDPSDPVPYLIAITTYSITITINILLLYIFYVHKNKSNSSKSITVTILLCLLFTLGRSTSWCASNVTLLMMVYKLNIHHLYHLLMIISAVGYFFQFLYSLATGYFFKIILEDTFNINEYLQVNKHFMWVAFSLYCLSAVIYNFFFGLIDGLNKTGYNTITYYTSLQWFIISPMYNVYILYAFIKRLRRSIKTINSNPNRKQSLDVLEDVVSHNTKQTNLIFLTVVAKLIYDIWSFNGTKSKISLIIWHFMYLIGITITMVCVLLTMRFNDNDSYYKTFCTCCHSMCFRFEKWLFDRQGAGFDYNYARLRPHNAAINSGSGNLFSSRPASDVLINVKPTKQCDGVNKCSSINGICTILTEQIKNDNKLLTFMRSGSYDPSQMINDFNHLISCHDSDSQYNQIYNRLNRHSTDSNHNKYKNCSAFSRHYSRERYRKDKELTETMKLNRVKPGIVYREQKNDSNNNDTDCVDAALLSIIDNIHSYYFHSYDRNLRSNKSQNKLLKTQDQIILMNQVDNVDLEINCQNKFNTSLQKNENNDVKHYSFGQRFEYEDRDHEWFVDEMSKNLKTELIEDEKHNISIRIYKINYEQCLLHMDKKVKYFKKLCNKNSKQILDMNHILSLLIYTNCTQYQYEWSASFRQQNNESCLDLKKRHKHFHYVSKFLIELIEGFGEILNESKQQIFYHGVSEFLCFTKTIAEFNGPLSTSEQLLVAQRFTSSQGMILEIKYASSVYPYKARYFDCMPLSDFSNERECLFIGGAPRMEIVNIYNVKMNYRGYGRYLKAINLITSLLNGEDICSQQHDTMNLCLQLLSNQSVTDYDTKMNLNFTKFPEDVAQQINQYCIELNNIVIFWHYLVNWVQLETLLAGNNMKKRIFFFNLNVITKIFPNIEQIEYYNASFKGMFTSKDKEIQNIVNYILQCKIWKENKKLKYIVIHHRIAQFSIKINNINNDYWKLCRGNKKTILYRNDIEFDVNLMKFHFDAIQLEKLANTVMAAKRTTQ
eukprot:476599_1